MVSISIIIPTHNRAQILEEVLNALEEQTYSPEKFEVLVCSDGSTDNTEEVVRRRHRPFPQQYFETGIHEHFAAAVARNIGLKHSRGDLLVFLDDDRVPARNFLEVQAQAHQQSWSCGPIVAYGPRLGPASIGSLDVPYPSSEDPRWKGVAHWFEDFENAPWQWATTAALSVHRMVATAIGGFNEEFSMYGFEDTDFAYRLYRYGCRFFFIPKLITIHRSHINNEELMEKMEALNITRRQFFELHPGAELQTSFLNGSFEV